MTRQPAMNPSLPRRTKLKQFGSLWVQSITAVDYRDGKAKTYDLVFVKRRGRFRLNHIHPHEEGAIPVETATTDTPRPVYGGSGPCAKCGEPSGTFIEGTALCPRCYEKKD